MASVKIVKMDGTEAGVQELSDAIFDVAPNQPLVHEVAKALQNARRQGTASTKTRREVRGGGAKPFRQKGTGNARQGSTREPHMRGGGTVFGPHPRSYRQRVAVSVKRKALCCALSDRVRKDALVVLDALACDAPKTKVMAELLERLAPGSRRTLLITAEANHNVVLSSRNIPGVTVTTADDMNALDVLTARRIIVVRDAVTLIEERLTKKSSAQESAA